MTPGDVSSLQSAVDDLNVGDVEPFLGLMSDDMVWSGSPHGMLWWRQRPR